MYVEIKFANIIKFFLLEYYNLELNQTVSFKNFFLFRVQLALQNAVNDANRL